MILQARIDSLEKELQLLSRDVAEDEAARQKLLAATQQATAMLETPPETIWRLLLQVDALLTHQRQSTAQYANTFSHVKLHLNAAIRTALEMGLFDIPNKSERGKSAGELAIITGSDKLLIGEQFFPCHARF